MRAFAGIPLSAMFAEWLEAYTSTLGSLNAEVQLVPATSCHMTLRFLGEVPRDRLEEMTDRLVESLAGTSRVQVVLDRTGVFFRNGRPSVLWLGPGTVSPDLAALAQKVDHALSEFGSSGRIERFTPHVTLGRFAKGISEFDAGIMVKRAVTPFSVEVQKVVLFESILGLGHPSYIPRAFVTLDDLPNEATELY